MTKPLKVIPSRNQPWEAVVEEPLPVNLQVRYRTGDGCFLPYAYLVFCQYDRGGTIELHFSSRIVKIEGRNLGELYTALCKHAVSSVQEGDHDESAPEAAPVISQLTVVEADD